MTSGNLEVKIFFKLISRASFWFKFFNQILPEMTSTLKFYFTPIFHETKIKRLINKNNDPFWPQLFTKN